MKQYQLRIIQVLLFFYLLSSYAGATHIHHDGLAVHHDCAVCIVVKNLHSSDTPDPVALPAIETIRYQKIALYRSLYVYKPIKGFNAHAPPLFS